ncbi:MAG: hypothetical protein ACE5DN_00320, partial [Flavobacteriales bacterium]
MKQLFYLFSLLIIAACGENNPTGIVHMLCDAENKAHMRGGTYFVNGDYVIANGQTQSDLESYSGKHSCLVTKENQYGMSVKFRNVKRGDR